MPTLHLFKIKIYFFFSASFKYWMIAAFNQRQCSH